MAVTLPKSVAEYFSAANTDDADRVAACFAADAVVRDEGRDNHGRDAIRRWAQEVRRKYRFHAEVTAVEEAADRIIVTAHLTGDFPGSPVDLRYRFKLAGPAIIALEIG
jgi:ketosteroid isomerase-like protein